MKTCIVVVVIIGLLALGLEVMPKLLFSAHTGEGKEPMAEQQKSSDKPEARLTRNQAFSKYTLEPFVTKYCLTCHKAEEKKGGFNMEEFLQEEDEDRYLVILQDIASMLREGEMPPEDEPKPTSQEATNLLRSIETELKDRLADDAEF